MNETLRDIVNDIIEQGGALLRDLVLDGVRARLGGQAGDDLIMAYIKGVQDAQARRERP